jgi:hypothetical protein
MSNATLLTLSCPWLIVLGSLLVVGFTLLVVGFVLLVVGFVLLGAFVLLLGYDYSHMLKFII